MIDFKEGVPVEPGQRPPVEAEPSPHASATRSEPHLSLAAVRLVMPILRLIHRLEEAHERARFIPSEPDQKLFVDAERVHELRDEQRKAALEIKRGTPIGTVLLKEAFDKPSAELAQIFCSYQREDTNLLSDFEFDSARQEAVTRMATAHEDLKGKIIKRLNEYGIRAQAEHLYAAIDDGPHAESAGVTQRLAHNLNSMRVSRESEFILVASSFNDDGLLQLILLQPHSALKPVKLHNVNHTWQEAQKIAQLAVLEASREPGFELHFEQALSGPSKSFPYRALTFTLRPNEVPDQQTIEDLRQRPSVIHMNRALEQARREALTKEAWALGKAMFNSTRQWIKRILES